LRGRFIELLLAVNLLAEVLPISRKTGRLILFAVVAVTALFRAPGTLQWFPALCSINPFIWTGIAMFAASGLCGLRCQAQ
jgi:hypothetical protein